MRPMRMVCELIACVLIVMVCPLAWGQLDCPAECCANELNVQCFSSIQDALDCAAAAPPDGCQSNTVFVPAGEYDVPETLTIASGVTLRGEGSGISVLRAAGSISGSILTAASGSGIHLKDLEFDGNERSFAISGVEFENVSDFSISGCLFHNFGVDGLVLNGTGSPSNGTITRCQSRYNTGAGFRVWPGNPNPGTYSELRFTACEAIQNTGDGFALKGVSNVALTACIADHGAVPPPAAGTAGFLVDSSEKVTLAAAIASGNNNGFSVVFGVDGLSFSGCIARDSIADGFYIRSSANVALAGCHAEGNGRNGVSVRTEYGDLAHHFSVVGGTISENARHGINLAGVKYGTISGVTVLNNSQDAGATYDGIRIANGVDTPTVNSQHITVSGCVISDDRDDPEDKTQNYAVRTLTGQGNISVFSNDVDGNLVGPGCDSTHEDQCPVYFEDCTSCEKKHNPGDATSG